MFGNYTDQIRQNISQAKILITIKDLKESQYIPTVLMHQLMFMKGKY